VTAPLYTVSIACHNRLDQTRRCLDSVLASEDSARTEIIVSDNASTDQTLEYLHQLARSGSPVQALRNDANEGFGKAHNDALYYAQGTYFVVLNNDAAVPSNWLSKMRQCFLDDPLVAVVGVNGTCKHLNSLGVGGGGFGEPDYIEGSCLMIPVALARRYTLFDPAYRFAYAEDSDLSLRLRKLGYRIAHADIDIAHQAGSTAQLVRARVDLDGFHALNHAQLTARWGDYLRTRTLDGQPLVIKRTDAIGDVLMLTPVLHALKSENPHREIVIATNCGEVLRDSPDARPAVRHATIDRDLDLCYERSPAEHPTDSFARALGVKGSDYRPRIFPSTAERSWAKRVMPGNRWCVIHPNIGQDSKAWPGRNWRADNFNLVAHRLAQGRQRCCPGQQVGSNWRFAVVGGANAPAIPQAHLDLRGRTTLHELAAIIERAALFLGVDSAPMHLARAALVPLVAVFGSINPQLRLSPHRFEAGVTADPMRVGCLGCHHAHEPPRTSGKCLRDREYCMERLTVERVLEAVPKVLEAKRMYLETSKIRERVLPYLNGKGADLGCGRDPITPDCYAVDDDPWPEVTHQCDIRKLPLKDAELDWVYSSHALEDLYDTEGALAEWLRVLKPGGIIGLYVPHPELYAKTGMANEEHVHNGFTPEELSALLGSMNCVVLGAYVHDDPGCYSTLVIARKMT
jgi:ADP-heptose:LPS heptosyltransferase/glycosyltransferase involved in cell wall biosynthesis